MDSTASVGRRIGAVALATLVATTVVAGAAAPRASASVPPTTAQRCFVDRTYRAFLGRPATSAEIVATGTNLGDGERPTVLIGTLAASDAWLGATVDRLYRDALDRAPDGAGRRYWVDQLRAGTSVNRFGGLVYGANEFYRRSGGTTPGFVAALYVRILGRPADAGGLAHWSTIVERDGRGPVAAAFFASTESRRERVTDLYRRLLGRAPDGAGLAHWTAALQSVNDVRLAVSLASSNEYLRRAERCALDGTITRLEAGGVLVYSQAISGDGRYRALLVDKKPTGPSMVRAAVVQDAVAGTSQQVNPTSCPASAVAQSREGRYVLWSNSLNPDQPDADCGTVSRVHRWDRTTGGTTTIGTGVVRDVSADGTRALVSDAGSGSALRLIGPGATTTTLPATMANAGPPVLSADGTTVVLPGTTVRRWTAASGLTTLATAVTPPSGSTVRPVAVSADGRKVAFWSDGPTLVPGDTNGSADLFLADTATGSVRALTDVTTARIADHPSVAMTPDASVVVFAPVPDDHPSTSGNQLTRWEAATGGSTELTHGRYPSVAAALSDDGTTVLFSSYDPALSSDVGTGMLEAYTWQLGPN